MAVRHNRISDAFITKSFKATQSIYKAAKRVGMSYVQTARRLNALGLVNTKTGRSR